MKSNLFNKKAHALPQLVLGLLMLIPVSSWALTAANTLIKNQASATFKDESGQSYSVTSNMVETLVQQVAGVDLVQSQAKRANADSTVNFPHILTNVGNGDDRYDLVTAELTSDQYDFSNVSLYADANQDGQPDDLSSPITTTPLLKADESFAFVAVAEVPSSVTDGDSGSFDLTASSQFETSTTASNTDTVDVTNEAIITVNKSMSTTAGASGSGPYTVTLRYENLSTVNADQVVLMDALPAGMDYVAGSGRWSETGSTALTDSDPADSHTATGVSLRYCAYDTTCTGLAEAQQDADSDSTNQVTAIIDQLVPGARGFLRFDVTIVSGLSASVLSNTAEYEYDSNGNPQANTPTNTVNFEVVQSSGVVTNGSATANTDGTDEPITVSSVVQGGTVSFTDYVWNTGNSDDSFDLNLSGSTFPTGSSIQLFQSDGLTPLMDTNGNGIPDTGSLAAGANKAVVIQVQLPPSATGDNGGAGYEVTLNATAYSDNSLSNPARNVLQTISTSSVDLTNDSAGGSAPGAGNGPEAAAVTTVSVQSGEVARFLLFISNTSTHSDNYDLAASTDSSFASQSLPAGWSVAFVDDEGRTLSNTGNIAPGASKQVYADVTVSADAPPATTSLYFRALSPVTNAVDIKHDAVTVTETVDLILSPDNQGQVLPGGSVLYTHTLRNQGNADISNIALNHSNDQSDWDAILYEDTDGNGEFGSADQPINNVANLAASDNKLLFIKVFAPASAAMGTQNLTTVTASWDGGAASTTATDLTSTNRSDVKITKKQALDSDCDGSAETAFSFDSFAAEPQQCVLYQLVADNTGAAEMHNVRIQDATPAYTSFITAGGLPTLSQGTFASAITDGAQGDIIGVVGTLAAGEQATLIFGIRIE